ncbi:MAG: hypothetical protein J5I47_13750 [Vicingus serpentipes]|nr:hypothetical protein [Vicingus serpentipes]
MSTFFYIKELFFCCLFTITYTSIFAQVDEYVIDEPEKKEAKNILFSQIPNPDFTNYFLTSSAFTLRSRDIRLSNTDILFSKGSYGLTNNTTASINVSFLGTTAGAIKHKIELNDELNLGVSASLGSLATISEDSLIYFIGGQSMITYGDHQDNITFGIGYYYVISTFELLRNDEQLPFYNIYLGLQKQIGRRTYFMGEAIYFPEYNVITGSAGIKVIIKNNMSLCGGLMPISHEYQYVGNRNIRQSIIIPLLSFRMLLDRH